MDTKSFKRTWMISDIHFGVRSSSLEWLDIHKQYFYEFFIPTLKQNAKEGDVLLVLGDVFDSRQYINILIMNEALEIFKKINDIMPIIMIVGNHDIYRKQSNVVNSLELFRNLKDVKILTEVETIEFQNATGLFMPWQDNHELELEVLKNSEDADYLFCHTGMRGFRYNKQVLLEDGLDMDAMVDFKAVYTGHIHHAQKQKNIRMIGCPFQLTRSDIGNQKSFWLLDLESNTEYEFQNHVSPKFLRIKLTNLFDLTIDELNRKFKNNFIDVFVSDDWSTKFPFGQFTDMLTGSRKIEFILTGGETNLDDLLNVENSGSVNMGNLIESYVNTLNFNENIKIKLKDYANRFYIKAVKNKEK